MAKSAAFIKVLPASFERMDVAKHLPVVIHAPTLYIFCVFTHVFSIAGTFVISGLRGFMFTGSGFLSEGLEIEYQ